MRCELEGFGNGWFQLYLRFSREDLDKLIIELRRLQEEGGHFHWFSTHEEASGVADIEISQQGDHERDNMHATYAGAIKTE